MVSSSSPLLPAESGYGVYISSMEFLNLSASLSGTIRFLYTEILILNPYLDRQKDLVSC